MKPPSESSPGLVDYPWYQASIAALGQWQQLDRVPHALILDGHRKGHDCESLALRLMAQLACTDQGAGSPCTQCRTCRTLLHGFYPDLHRLSSGSEQKQLGVDQVRSACITLSQSAYTGGYRFVLVEDAEQMTHAAANALLKTLEEPGQRTLLLLQTSRVSALPATIRSRCQRLSLSATTRPQLLHWLMQRAKIGETEARQALQAAHELPLLALKYLEDGTLTQRQAFFLALDRIGAGARDIEPILALVGTLPAELSSGWIGSWLIERSLSARAAGGTAAGVTVKATTEAYQSFLKLLNTHHSISVSQAARELLYRWVAIYSKVSSTPGT